MPSHSAASRLGTRGHAIEAIGLVHEYRGEHGRKRVLDDISFRIEPGEKFAIMGRNGAGKSTLIKIIAGAIIPTSGSMYVGMKTSWPLALQGGFEPNLTGYDNVRFISEIYRVPFRETLDQVTDFAELGRDIYMPLQYYSNGMRARLAFALSLTIDFECLLIDEVLAVGDRRFQRKCEYEMFERRKHHTMIVAIHAPDFVAQNCSRAMVIKNGRARIFDDVKLAAEIYSTL